MRIPYSSRSLYVHLGLISIETSIRLAARLFSLRNDYESLHGSNTFFCFFRMKFAPEIKTSRKFAVKATFQI